MSGQDQIAIDRVTPGRAPTNLDQCILVVLRSAWALVMIGLRDTRHVKHAARVLSNSGAVGTGHRHLLINDESRRFPLLADFVWLVGARRGEIRACALGILVQLVSDAADRQDVMGIFGIVFQLLAQPIDVGIDVTLIAFVFSTPNPIEQIVRDQHAPVSRSYNSESETQRCQVNALAATRYFMPPLGDHQVANFHPIAVALLLGRQLPRRNNASIRYSSSRGLKGFAR